MLLRLRRFSATLSLMTPYQIFQMCVLIGWPLMIFGILFLMSRLEKYVERPYATTPEEAGLEPVSGGTGEREVQIVFGDKVIGESPEKSTTS